MRKTQFGSFFASLGFGILAVNAQIDIQKLTGAPGIGAVTSSYQCPPRSRIQLFDAPLSEDPACPNAMDKRYAASADKTFYILCCRHVDDGKKALSIVPDVPSLKFCISICSHTVDCKSVLYTARAGYNSNYPLKTCELFAAGDYSKQSPCNNDAHDSAFLIEPPEFVSPPVFSPAPPEAIGHKWVQVPGNIDEGCAQNFIKALKVASCSQC